MRLLAAAQRARATLWFEAFQTIRSRADALIDEHTDIPTELPFMRRLRLLLAMHLEEEGILGRIFVRRPAMRTWISRVQREIREDLALGELVGGD